jgi:hypothetical protein
MLVVILRHRKGINLGNIFFRQQAGSSSQQQGADEKLVARQRGVAPSRERLPFGVEIPGAGTDTSHPPALSQDFDSVRKGRICLLGTAAISDGCLLCSYGIDPEKRKGFFLQGRCPGGEGELGCWVERRIGNVTGERAQILYQGAKAVSGIPSSARPVASLASAWAGRCALG